MPRLPSPSRQHNNAQTRLYLQQKELSLSIHRQRRRMLVQNLIQSLFRRMSLCFQFRPHFLPAHPLNLLSNFLQKRLRLRQFLLQPPPHKSSWWCFL